ncbi:MAG: hypothetical protein KTR24_18150 [Saprospiraceae bacterium]|nr:hypothetical protein [Saprospiraceae bacterium]
MIKTTRLIAFFLLVSFSACIPSLHPIATQENQVIDDRLLGTWHGQLSQQTGIEVSFSIEGDDSLDVVEGEKELELLKQELETKSEVETWTFERVGAISFKRGTSSAKVDPAVPSLLNWEVEEMELHDYYHLSYRNWQAQDTTVERMWCHLTKIEEQLFIDFSPSHLKNPVMHENARFAMNYISGHTFAKIEFVDEKMILHPLNSTFIEELLKQKRIRLKHEVINSNIVLTASTEEIRAFIKRYLGDPNLFDESESLSPHAS